MCVSVCVCGGTGGEEGERGGERRGGVVVVVVRTDDLTHEFILARQCGTCHCNCPSGQYRPKCRVFGACKPEKGTQRKEQRNHQYQP